MIILTFISILGLASSIPLKHPNNKSIVQLPIEQHPSLRERLIRSGNWSEYKTWKNSQLFKNKKSAPLIDYADAEFLVKISQGTPAQTFKVIVDTGSSDYWLIDSSCVSSACNGVDYVHRKFHSSRSSTFQNDGTSVEVDYETGTMQGYLAYDVVNLVGLTYSQQGFILATSLSDNFGKMPLDGILGLGWPNLAQDGCTPPMQNFLDQLDQPLFTIYLKNHLSLTMDGYGGQMTLGSIDKTNCASNINYVPVTSSSYWQFSIQGWGIGSSTSNKNQQVFIDTGTSYLCGPPNAIQTIADTIGAKYSDSYGLYTISCHASGLPDVVFNIGGTAYHISKNEYMGLGLGQCVVLIYALDNGGFSASWILGDPFLRSYCSVFDIGNQQVGFSKANN